MKKILFILLLFVSVCISVHADDYICSNLSLSVLGHTLTKPTIEYSIQQVYIEEGKYKYKALPDTAVVDSLHILETQTGQYNVVLRQMGPLSVDHQIVDVMNFPRAIYYLKVFMGECELMRQFFNRRDWFTDIEEPSAEALQDRTYKYIRNGQVLIHRGDADYDLTGRKMELRE